MSNRHGFTLYLRPVQQGSKTPGIRGDGKAYLRDDNASTLKPYREALTNEARDAWTYHDQLTGDVRAWIRFTFDRPRSHYRTGRNAHRLRDSAPTRPTRQDGDLDKLVRAVCDALTDAGVWQDDTQLVDLRARKSYAGENEYALPRAGVQIILEEIDGRTP